MSQARSMAQALLEEADFDLTAAKRLAHKRIAEDAALVTELWQSAIDRLLEDAWRSGRGSYWQAVAAQGSKSSAPVTRDHQVSDESQSRPVDSSSARTVLLKGETSTPSPSLQRAVTRELQGLMAFQMPGGRVLGEYQKSELDQLGLRVVRMGRSTMATGFFFRAVAAMLPKSRDRVADVLTNNDLERVMRQQGSAKALQPLRETLPQTV